MKLWKLLLATMIALVLVCAVAMAETATECSHTPYMKTTKYPTCTEGSVDTMYYCSKEGCTMKDVVWYEVKNDNKLGHNWSATNLNYQAPTCTAEGAKTVYCAQCKTYEVWVIEKLDHVAIPVAALTVAPTCTTEGVNYFKCGNNCGATWTKTVDKIAHNLSGVTGVNATCATEGFTDHQVCSMCKGVFGKVTLPKTAAHTDAVKIAANCVAPTCVKDGSDYYLCRTCGAEYTKVVKATGAHDWKDVPAKAANCVEDGYTAHAICKVCKYESNKVVVPATGSAHEWKYNGKVKPTCEKEGYEMDKCAKCGEYSVYNKVAALGHDYSIITDSKVATCTEKGFEERKCATCGGYKYFDIAKLGHNHVGSAWTVRLAPKCTTEGLEYNVCTMCGGDEQTRAIAATGHKMSEKVYEYKAATCTETGLGTKICANCTYEETVEIKALGHSTWTDTVANATCTLPGMKHVWCTRCKVQLSQNEIIPAKGHKGEVTKYVAPTCTTEGTKTTKCENCKQTVTETIAKLAHKYEWITTPATPSANGKSEYKCACGDIAETKTIKYTKWYYNNTMTSFGPTTKELVGGNDWYRVTPVDLAVDGVYTYDLIASNKYIVGKVTITVNAGALTVSYKTNYSVDVKDEALLIYASKADLATGTAVTAPVGAAINAAETFGADTKVLVSLILTGDYDAAGKGLVDASAAAGMIANID